MRPSIAALVIGTVLAVLRTSWWLGRLPDPLATHFAGDGLANGWMSHQGFVAFTWVMWGVLVASFWTLGPVLRRVPASRVSLPNREYWLAPERREATIVRLQAWMERFGLATMALMAAVLELALRANLTDPPRLDNGPFWWLMGIATVGTTAFIVGMIRAFRLPR